MSDYGVVLEAGTVRFERLLPGPIERVWTYLTDSEARGKWLATGPMDLHPGGEVELRFNHADLSPIPESVPEPYKQFEGGVTSHGQVIRCDPPRLLSMTWGAKQGAAPGEGSEVTFELSPQGGEVRLVLTHRRLATRAGMLNVSGGWHTHLAILRDHLEGREPPPFWATLGGLAGEYESRLAKVEMPA